jgi:hypothetical protein
MLLTDTVQAAVRSHYRRLEEGGRFQPLGRDIMLAIVAALDGSCATGRDMLRAVIRAHGAMPPPNDMVQSNLVVGCLVCDDLDLASEVLGASHGLRVGVSLGTAGRRPAPAQVVDCTVAGPEEIGFALPVATFGAPGFLTRMSRWLACVPLFARCARLPGGPSGQVRLQLIDGAFRPGLGFCARTDAVTLIPDPDFMRAEGYRSLREHLDRAPVPWGERRPVALWRGAANGQIAPGEDWLSLPRIRLCGFMDGPDAALFDLGITSNTLPAHDPGRALLPGSGLMRPAIEATAFQAWRYQIDIDGFTNAWSGLFQKLLTGSTVLKVASEGGWRQWYYDRLVPWTHFVPVRADMADLAEKVAWLVAHDDEARRIGEAGRALAVGLTLEAETKAGAEAIASVLC